MLLKLKVYDLTQDKSIFGVSQIKPMILIEGTNKFQVTTNVGRDYIKTDGIIAA